MFEKIRERYQRGYIRDDQLARYVSLGVITQAQADEQYSNPTGGGPKE